MTVSNNIWLNTTVTRPASVVPAHGFGMGDVCPSAAGYAAATKRSTDAFQATKPGSATPWSPPVT